MNQLTRIDEFRQILADYHVSDEALSILASTKLVLLVGPSSSGRNTIINELLTTGDYHYIVSDTTRKPRVNNGIPEQNGREYWFRSEDELLADLQAGMFLEAAIIHNQQVSGISIRELSAAAKEGKIAINEIEVVGGESIHAVKPDALFLFIVPPSFDEWMTRMKARGELPEDESRRRLESAVQELRYALAHDYYRFVVNDTFKHTARDIHAMAQGLHVPNDDEARVVAEQLLRETEQFLGR